MLRKIAGICGIASQFVALATLLFAVSKSPWFSWTENDISVLGVNGSVTALVNSGFILTGVLSLIFAIGLRRNLLTSRLGQLGMVSLVLGSIMIAAIGVFPRTIGLPHDVASIAAFVFITLALFLVGVSALTASHIVWGLLSLAGAVIMVVFQLVPWPWSGGSIPQLLISLPWSLLTLILGVGLLLGFQPVDVYQKEKV